MRWNVEGADAKTGKNRVVQVYAKDSTDAEEKARKLGVLVTAVHESVMKPANDTPGGELAEETFDVAPAAPAPANNAAPVVARATRATTAVASAPPRNDRDEARRKRAIPDYPGLSNAAFVLGVFSTLYYVLGAIPAADGADHGVQHFPADTI